MSQSTSWNISYGRVVKVVFSQTSSYSNSSDPILCSLMDFSKSFFQKYSFDLPSVVTSPSHKRHSFANIFLMESMLVVGMNGVSRQNGLLPNLNIKIRLHPKQLFKVALICPHKHKDHFYVIFVNFPICFPSRDCSVQFSSSNPSPTNGSL